MRGHEIIHKKIDEEVKKKNYLNILRKNWNQSLISIAQNEGLFFKKKFFSFSLSLFSFSLFFPLSLFFSLSLFFFPLSFLPFFNLLFVIDFQKRQSKEMLQFLKEREEEEEDLTFANDFIFPFVLEFAEKLREANIVDSLWRYNTVFFCFCFCF